MGELPDCLAVFKGKGKDEKEDGGTARRVEEREKGK